MSLEFRKEEGSHKCKTVLIALPVPLEPIGDDLFAFHDNPHLEKYHFDKHVGRKVEAWLDLFLEYRLLSSRYDDPSADLYARVSGYNLFSNLIVPLLLRTGSKPAHDTWWALGLDGVLLWIDVRRRRGATVVNSFRADAFGPGQRNASPYDHFCVLFRKMDTKSEEMRLSCQEQGGQTVQRIELDRCPTPLEWSRMRAEFRERLSKEGSAEQPWMRR